MISTTRTLSLSPASELWLCVEDGGELELVLLECQSANPSSLPSPASYLSSSKSPASTEHARSRSCSCSCSVSVSCLPEQIVVFVAFAFAFKPTLEEETFSLFSHIWTREDAPSFEVWFLFVGVSGIGIGIGVGVELVCVCGSFVEVCC